MNRLRFLLASTVRARPVLSKIQTPAKMQKFGHHEEGPPQPFDNMPFSIPNRCYCDIFPSSEIKIIRRKDAKQSDNLKEKNKSKENVENVSKEFRVNEVNIQMISRNIYDQLFKNTTPSVDDNIVKSHLPDVELTLPELAGNDVVEHFYNIAEEQCAPYRVLLKELAEFPVPYPPDDALVFDVEVLMSAGRRPTLACAASPEAW
ncbi:putative DNA polymerase subunit gamma 1, mitochondrial [Operophtera brumata]|uniref:Putative DNA polymerase subunit gamma 1, mitochondrial n=1 Tax=Operophtera brumata TaxID=104452 RepID=A0A0L7LKA6_OPEBR|nr:putative DNA polymerase subunit gamma 1, mitochondrial [Operophtera brumata]